MHNSFVYPVFSLSFGTEEYVTGFMLSRASDIDDIRYIVNYDYPSQTEDYIHRIGRTGRSDKKGTSYTFFTAKQSRLARELIEVLKEAKQEIPDELLDLVEEKDNHRRGRGRRHYADSHSSRSRSPAVRHRRSPSSTSRRSLSSAGSRVRSRSRSKHWRGSYQRSSRSRRLSSHRNEHKIRHSRRSRSHSRSLSSLSRRSRSQSYKRNGGSRTPSSKTSSVRRVSRSTTKDRSRSSKRSRSLSVPNGTKGQVVSPVSNKSVTPRERSRSLSQTSQRDSSAKETACNSPLEKKCDLSIDFQPISMDVDVEPNIEITGVQSTEHVFMPYQRHLVDTTAEHSQFTESEVKAEANCNQDMLNSVCIIDNNPSISNPVTEVGVKNHVPQDVIPIQPLPSVPTEYSSAGSPESSIDFERAECPALDEKCISSPEVSSCMKPLGVTETFMDNSSEVDNTYPIDLLIDCKTVDSITVAEDPQHDIKTKYESECESPFQVRIVPNVARSPVEDPFDVAEGDDTHGNADKKVEVTSIEHDDAIETVVEKKERRGSSKKSKVKSNSKRSGKHSKAKCKSRSSERSRSVSNMGKKKTYRSHTPQDSSPERQDSQRSRSTSKPASVKARSVSGAAVSPDVRSVSRHSRSCSRRSPSVSSKHDSIRSISPRVQSPEHVTDSRRSRSASSVHKRRNSFSPVDKSPERRYSRRSRSFSSRHRYKRERSYSHRERSPDVPKPTRRSRSISSRYRSRRYQSPARTYRSYRDRTPRRSYRDSSYGRDRRYRRRTPSRSPRRTYRDKSFSRGRRSRSPRRRRDSRDRYSKSPRRYDVGRRRR